MNCKQALLRSKAKRTAGLIIGIPAALTLTISVFKFIYFRIDNGSHVGSVLATPCKWFVHWVYTHTPFLSVVWDHAPVPNHATIATVDNLYFLVIYAAVFVAMALRAAGRKLAARYEKIREMLDEEILSAAHAKMARSIQDLENTVEIPDASVFSQTRQLCIAPLVVAAVGVGLLKLAGF